MIYKYDNKKDIQIRIFDSFQNLFNIIMQIVIFQVKINQKNN